MNKAKGLYSRSRKVVGLDGLILVGVVIILLIVAAALCTKSGEEEGSEETGWQYTVVRTYL